MATPIALAAIGGMFSERVGVINIGLEGIMLTGAFTGVATSYYTRNPWLGVLASIISGALIGLLHAFLTVTLKGNQIVSGTGINILAVGVTAFMCEVIWGSRGASESVPALNPINIPILREIPILGDILGTHTPIVYLMFLIIFLSQILLFRTPFGLRLRAVGENPAAADTAGVNVTRINYMGIILSCMLAGLSGAFLSLGSQARLPLANLFGQVVGALFSCLEMHAPDWRSPPVVASAPDVKFDDASAPPPTDTAPLVDAFKRDVLTIRPILGQLLSEETLVRLLGAGSANGGNLSYPDDLWATTVYEFAASFHRSVIHPTRHPGAGAAVSGTGRVNSL